MTTTLEPRRRTGSTIRLIASYRGLRTDKALADVMNEKRATVNRYTRGEAAPDVDWLEAFAQALMVPAAILLMEPDKAMAWVLEHAPNGGMPSTKWLTTPRSAPASPPQVAAGHRQAA